MLGSFSVGKTSLVSRFVHSMFSDKYLTTVGVKVDKKVVDVDGKQAKLMLWDLAGKDDFAEIPTSYLRGMGGYLLVVDGTREATLDMAAEVRKQVQDTLGDIPHVMLLNKADLIDDWEIDLERVEAFDCPNLRTSCMTGEGVEEAFLQLTKLML